MPLIYWSINAAQESKYIDDFIVSTEDEEIANIAKLYGANVHLRPKELSEDYSTTVELLQYIAQKYNYTNIVLLQPTSPIRHNNLIDRCIEQFMNSKVDTLATGSIVHNYEWATTHNTPRQLLKGWFYDDGNIYIHKADYLKQGKWFGENRLEYTVEDIYNYEIDNLTDFFIVEKLLETTLQHDKKTNTKKIKLFLSDVDGTLTDAGMYYGQNGEEFKKFNTHDGKGFELLRKVGIKTGIITSENTKIVENRAKKLKVDYLYQGLEHIGKLEIAKEICKKENITLDEVAYIGDDINCKELLENVGLAACPSNALDEIKQIQNIIKLSKKGGDGAVREFINKILAQ